MSRSDRNHGHDQVALINLHLTSTGHTKRPMKMASRSEDEWSLVSDNQDVLSDVSFNEPDEEPEDDAEVECKDPALRQEPLNNQDELLTNEEESAKVLSLLADAVAAELPAIYSRKVLLCLLSSVHQQRYVISSPRQAPPSHTTKLAFVGSGTYLRSSFPERLRAITKAMRPAKERVAQPKLTEVTPFQQNQSTQVNFEVVPERREDNICTPSRQSKHTSVNFDTSVTSSKQDQSTQAGFEDIPAGMHETHRALLCKALDRSMTLASQLHAKSMDCERLLFRIAELESVMVHTEQQTCRHGLAER